MGSTAIFKSIHRIYFEYLDRKAHRHVGLFSSNDFWLTNELAIDGITGLQEVHSLQEEPFFEKWLASQFGR